MGTGRTTTSPAACASTPTPASPKHSPATLKSAVAPTINANLSSLPSSPTWLKRLAMAGGTVVSSTCQSGAVRDLDITWKYAKSITIMKMLTTHLLRARFTTAEALFRSPTTTTTEDSDPSISQIQIAYSTTTQWTLSNPLSGSGPKLMVTNQACTASPPRAASDSANSPISSTVASSVDLMDYLKRPETESHTTKICAKNSDSLEQQSVAAPISLPTERVIQPPIQ